MDDELAAYVIVDPDAEQAYQQVLDDLEIGYLRDLTDELDERERIVVRAHYGLGEHQQTLDEIGARLGLTAERARQIEVGALNKLREGLAQPAI
jgi:RNA polymerase primary sigma factor